MKIGVGIMCVMTLILSVQGRILHLEESIKVARVELVQFKVGQILEDLFRLGIAMADRLIRISRSHDVKTPV